MTHVIYRLTAKNRDQLQNPMLSNRVWTTFTFMLLPIQQSWCKTKWTIDWGLIARVTTVIMSSSLTPRSRLEPLFTSPSHHRLYSFLSTDSVVSYHFFRPFWFSFCSFIFVCFYSCFFSQSIKLPTLSVCARIPCCIIFSSSVHVGVLPSRSPSVKLLAFL